MVLLYRIIESKTYFLEVTGLELLEIIYFQTERRIVEYSDFTLKIKLIANVVKSCNGD